MGVVCENASLSTKTSFGSGLWFLLDGGVQGPSRALNTCDSEELPVSTFLAYGRLCSSVSPAPRASEGVPALFFCSVSDLPKEDCPISFVSLPGNLLDIAVIDDLIIASVDNIHKAGSTSEVDENNVPFKRLQVISLEKSNDEKIDHVTRELVEINELMTTEWHEKSLQTLLYATESLRKHREAEDNLLDET